MKKFTRTWFINGLGLATLATAMTGISYGDGIGSLIVISGWLTVLGFILRPLLKILLMPINLLTFGLLGWMIHVLILYVTTIFAPNFSINAFDFGPVTLLSFSIPKIVLSQFWALVFVSFSLNLIRKVIRWLL